MRRGTFIIICANIILLTWLVHMFSDLLSILDDRVGKQAITPAEIPHIGESLDPSIRTPIPKIIHQTYKNTTIPVQWRTAQKACIDLHPDYEYKLWTDADAREFIKKEYPWFLETFDGYPFNIQRADSIRYFVLYHFGGIYIDLDDECKRKLDPLRQYDGWMRKTSPTGVSNDVMGATPGHPFFKKVIDRLQYYDRNWIIPYVTIMYSTGPLMLSVVMKHYYRDIEFKEFGLKILMRPEYTNNAEPFFKIHKGNSWHSDDAGFIFWLQRYWPLVTIAGFAIFGLINVAIWRSCTKRGGSGEKAGYGRKPWWRSGSSSWVLYQRLPKHEV